MKVIWMVMIDEKPVNSEFTRSLEVLAFTRLTSAVAMLDKYCTEKHGMPFLEYVSDDPPKWAGEQYAWTWSVASDEEIVELHVMRMKLVEDKGDPDNNES